MFYIEQTNKAMGIVLHPALEVAAVEDLLPLSSLRKWGVGGGNAMCLCTPYGK